MAHNVQSAPLGGDRALRCVLRDQPCPLRSLSERLVDTVASPLEKSEQFRSRQRQHWGPQFWWAARTASGFRFCTIGDRVGASQPPIVLCAIQTTAPSAGSPPTRPPIDLSFTPLRQSPSKSLLHVSGGSRHDQAAPNGADQWGQPVGRRRRRQGDGAPQLHRLQPPRRKPHHRGDGSLPAGAEARRQAMASGSTPTRDLPRSFVCTSACPSPACCPSPPATVLCAAQRPPHVSLGPAGASPTFGCRRCWGRATCRAWCTACAAARGRTWR